MSTVSVCVSDNRRNSPHSGTISEEALLGDLHSVYYRNRDLKLLLDLLAESSGIAPSIRVMSLFDRGFRAGAEVTALEVARRGEGEAEVSFRDAPTLVDIFSRIEQVR